MPLRTAQVAITRICMSQSERQVAPRQPDSRVQEVRASAHLMSLDTGTFCLVNGSVKASGDLISGVRVSTTDPADANVTVSTFRTDGWIGGGGDAALIRVINGPAQVLITIYQPAGTNENPPRLRVLRLSDTPEGETAEAAAASSAPAVRRPVMILTEPHDVIAHIQRTGDIGRAFGEWVGTPESQMAIEGFSLTAPKGLEASDLSYRAVLGRGWLSPWVESGQFCGSRGMALPILGLQVKLSAAAAKLYELRYSATFIDGTKLDDLGSEDSCETPSLAALESMRINIQPKTAGKTAGSAAATTGKGTAPPPAALAKGKHATAAKPVDKPTKGSKPKSR